MSRLSRLLALAFACLSAVFLYGSARLLMASLYAIADTPSSVAHALEWTPGDAVLHLRYAGLWRNTPENVKVRAHLATAVALNPRLTTARLALADLMENTGEVSRAEALLLDAAKLDHQFDPAWALANFYFRQGNRPRFEEWLGRAAAMAYEGGRPLFALAWRAELPPEFVVRRIVRGREAMARSMLAFSVDAKTPDWAAVAAPALLAVATREDQDLLYSVVEMLLYAGRIKDAEGIWNRIPGRRPELAATGLGFDWRLRRMPGVRMSAASGLHVEFVDPEAAAYDLASRIAPVSPGGPRLLTAQSQSDEMPRGFRWTVSSWPGLHVLAVLDLHPGRLPQSDSVSFEVPPGVHAVHVLLSYERPVGALRFSGTLDIPSVLVETKVRRRAPEKELVGEIRGSAQEVSLDKKEETARFDASKGATRIDLTAPPAR